jgi:glutathione S-transferase
VKLYGSIISPFVARVVYAARLKGLTLEPESLPGGGLKSDEFLKLNPIGKMPTLHLGDSALAESMVILDYLEDAHPTPALLSAAPIERARERLLGRIVDLYVAPSSRGFFANMNPQKRNEEDVEAAKQSYLKGLAYIEHFLGDGKYAHGERLGYADCALLPCLQMMHIVATACGIADPYAGLPRLTRWWQQMQADPVSNAFIKEYAVAFEGFMKSRR